MLFFSGLLFQYPRFGRFRILLYFLNVLCLFCVFYTHHLSDDIDSISMVLSSNCGLLPLDLGYKPPHCVIFSSGYLSYV